MSDSILQLTNQADQYLIKSEVVKNKLVSGQGGSDVILGSAEADQIQGNLGADILVGNDGNDSLSGGQGSDLLLGGKGNDVAQGDRGNDLIFGGQGDDSLVGQAGNDLLAGDTGRDTLAGGDGSDAFVLDLRKGVSNVNDIDIIVDFNFDEQGDIFALTDGTGKALSVADITLEASGNDTLIRAKNSNLYLAKVIGQKPEQVTSAFSTFAEILDDTEPGATRLNLTSGKAQFSEFVGDADYSDLYQFSLTQSSIVDLSLSNLKADLDLVLYQDLDGDGEVGSNEIVSAAQQSGTTTEAIENLILAPGQYFVGVEQFEGDTNYQLEVNATPGTVARDLAGNTLGQARTLQTDGVTEYNDALSSADPIDLYKVDLKAGYFDVYMFRQTADVTVSLGRDSDNNGKLEGKEIIKQAKNGITLDSATPGTYYLQLQPQGADTAYQILAENEPGSRLGDETINIINPNVQLVRSLTQQDSPDPESPENFADTYALQAVQPGQTVTVTQRSQQFDTYLTLVDRFTGEILAENNDINTEAGDIDSQITFVAEADREYLVRASSADNPGLGEYSLKFTLSGTPTPVNRAIPRNSSPLPLPVFNEEGDRADVKSGPGTTKHDLVYKPLAGPFGIDGSIQPANIRITGINQGTFGNCAFLAGLGATFSRVTRETANTVSNPLLQDSIQVLTDASGQVTGYKVRFFDEKTLQPSFVEVDNQVVTALAKNGEPLSETEQGQLFGNTPFGPIKDPANPTNVSIWATIVERAYAKWRGEQTGKNGYDVIGNGDSGTPVLRRLTGLEVESFYFREAGSAPKATVVDDNSSDENRPEIDTAQGLFDRIRTALDEGRYVYTGAASDANKLSGGKAVGGHAFTITDAFVDANGTKKVLIRNPWGSLGDNNDGVFFDEDPSKIANDGFLEVNYENYLKYWSSVDITKTKYVSSGGTGSSTPSGTTGGTTGTTTSTTAGTTANGFLDADRLSLYSTRISQAGAQNAAFKTFGAEDDTVDITTSDSSANPAGFLTFAGNDTVTGSASPDVVFGGQGNDDIAGAEGNDLLRGGQGNDLINGEADSDIIHGNLGDDTVNGGDGDDFIRGGQGNDQLSGEAGRDALLGDRGRDSLTGGAGADSFVLRLDTVQGVPASEVSVITDFSLTDGDRLILTGNIDRATVSFTASGSDVLVQAAGQVMGRITNGASISSSLLNSTVIVAANDSGLAFG